MPVHPLDLTIMRGHGKATAPGVVVHAGQYLLREKLERDDFSNKMGAATQFALGWLHL